MTMNHLSNVDIKNSKTDLPVPVINSVHLHSIYNPEREAQSFVSANEKLIEKSSQILVFGLGFGYHLISLETKLKGIFPKGYEVYCIDPNKNLVEKWKELRPATLSSKIKVINYDEIQDYYKDISLVNFLSNKPTILPHPASFQLNEAFFKSFMSFHYPTTVSQSLHFIQDSELKEYLAIDGTHETTDEFFKRIENKNFLQGKDFLTLALSEMVTGN